MRRLPGGLEQAEEHEQIAFFDILVGEVRLSGALLSEGTCAHFPGQLRIEMAARAGRETFAAFDEIPEVAGGGMEDIHKAVRFCRPGGDGQGDGYIVNDGGRAASGSGVKAFSREDDFQGVLRVKGKRRALRHARDVLHRQDASVAA